MSSDDTRAIECAPDAAPRAPDDPLLGKLIDGKYLVEKLIGQGGMGKVYRGRNVRTESPVAIKTLIPDLVRDDALIKRFEIEAKSASNLRHPNTIRIFDFGQEGDVLFMVMELLDGQSLEGLLRSEKRLDPRRLIRIMRETCESLAEAHAQGLVHRDLKPDNIFLNRVGDHADGDFVKVLDFGVAKLRDKRYGNATLTQAGMIFGTPRYMSPEQARAFDIDQRSDIYALGVIMYECLSGEVLFDGNDPVAILIQHVQEPPVPFAKRVPDLPPMPDLEGVVMRCLAKKPDERYSDVRELIGELERIDTARVQNQTAGLIAPAVVATQVMRDGRLAPTPPNSGGAVRTDGFDALGVGVSPHRDPTYALGDGAVRGTTEMRVDAAKRNPLPLVIGGVVVVLLAAGAGILAMLVGSDPAPTDAPADPVVEAPAEPAPAPTMPDIGPQLAIAADRLAAARTSAADIAARSVVRIRVEAGDVEGATATPIGVEGAAPLPLPHEFTFIQPPDAPARAAEWNVEAPGYVTQAISIPVERREEPVVVELRRPAARPSGGDSGRRPGGGLVDPYANP